MHNFKIGDRVEMVEKQSKHTGKRGVVVDINSWRHLGKIVIQFDDKELGLTVTFPAEYFRKIEYKAGDEVTIRATVQEDNVKLDKTVLCRFHSPLSLGGTSFCFSVSEADIITHTPKPRPIQVGDMVGFNDIKFHVMGLHDEYAWLKRIRDNNMIIDQEFYTLKLNALERI